MFDEARNQPAVFDGRTSALDWLTTELPTLRALVDLAHDSGRNHTAWHLCEAMWELFSYNRHYDAWLQTHTAGLAAAHELGEPAARARMLVALSSAHLHLGDVETAANGCHRAHELWLRVGHRLGQASALESLGVTDLVSGNPRSAIARFSRALALVTAEDDPRAITMMHRRLGEAHRDAGNHDHALDYLTHAHQHFAAIGDDYMTSRLLIGLADLHIKTHRGDQARTALDEALHLAQRAQAPMEIARSHQMLGDVAMLRGHVAHARHHLQRALSGYTAFDAPEADEVGRLLARLDPGEEEAPT
ncbi:tetratricopeptide (TPR) repeat protein [Lipingzhangella halophila]|uniref:Tetratricopeptide (TPR) repeat protein n=1 Tax=Lipingzhangella halophila TaxID=1783352 RepID=A0A7W7W1I9_9ACTN|nr:tetratricopeptide repeat protein [Lipingzhangella halophila]MBB4930691.1 tetratricopeptide (TPR) repeat protein [Lipingzhangella halophila]